MRELAGSPAARVERQQKRTPRATNVDLLGSVRSALPRVPRACGAVQGKLAFASRFAPLDSVLVARRWTGCVRPGASPQLGVGSGLLSPRGSIFLSPDSP